MTVREWMNRNGWLILGPLMVMALFWFSAATSFPLFFWVMIGVSVSGGAFGGTNGRRTVTESRTLLVDPQGADLVNRVLEAAMRGNDADQLWRALDKATDAFGAITDPSFYSWVDAQAAALPPGAGSRSREAGWTDPGVDGRDTTQPPQTWVQPPH